MRKGKLLDFENTIGYVFHNKSWVDKALTHPSLQRSAKDFERLEFLGDRVLGIVVAEWLYKAFPKDKEGHLAKRLASLVCRETCEAVAGTLRLSFFLYALESEKQDHTTVMSDAVEALIGAMFLDGGLDPCQTFIRRFWQPLLHTTLDPPKDPKSKLQEWIQSLGKPIPTYHMVDMKGTQHTPVFYIDVCIEGWDPIQGEGRTKRLAERDAAKRFLAQYHP